MKLRNFVSEWAKENNLEDVVNHGCQSGVVSDLIYYHDTINFYKSHQSEINNLLGDLMDDTGFDCPSDLFGDKWDKEDPLALDTSNQNLLAWFGFEETANRILMDEED